MEGENLVGFVPASSDSKHHCFLPSAHRWRKMALSPTHHCPLAMLCHALGGSQASVTVTKSLIKLKEKNGFRGLIHDHLSLLYLGLWQVKTPRQNAHGQAKPRLPICLVPVSFCKDWNRSWWGRGKEALHKKLETLENANWEQSIMLCAWLRPFKFEKMKKHVEVL